MARRRQTSPSEELAVRLRETVGERPSARRCAIALTDLGYPISSTSITNWVERGYVRASRSTPRGPIRVDIDDLASVVVGRPVGGDQ